MSKNKLAVTFLLFGALLSGAQQVSAAACPAANPTDFVSDDAALNACLAQGGTVSLGGGSPGYIIEAGLVLSVPSTIFEGSGIPGQTPTLIAHPLLRAPMLRVPYVNGFTIRHLRFDGNRGMRSAYIHDCSGPTYDERTHGYNLKLGGSNFLIEYVQSDNAMCGSSLEVDGSGYTIRQSSLVNNGWSYGTSVWNSWADGITLLFCANAVIEDNTIGDSTDIGLIVGPGIGTCVVRRNVIYQLNSDAFVGMMVGFGDHASGATHSGLSMTNNTVYSAYDRAIVGLLVGHHASDPNVQTSNAGNIQYNDIQGAVILAAIDGIGAGTFLNNTGGNPQGNRGLPPECQPGIAYTAGHFGSAVLQPGWVPRVYHGGCQTP